MATFYEGTPLSEFKEMPLDELFNAQTQMERISEEREAELKRRRERDQ